MKHYKIIAKPFTIHQKKYYVYRIILGIKFFTTTKRERNIFVIHSLMNISCLIFYVYMNYYIFGILSYSFISFLTINKYKRGVIEYYTYQEAENYIKKVLEKDNIKEIADFKFNTKGIIKMEKSHENTI